MSISFGLMKLGSHNNQTPVFNKRVFKAQAGIVLTEDVLKILKQPCSQERSTTDLHKLKSVVNGLKDVHKGFQFVKDALSIVVGYEKVEANIEVERQPDENGLSCYYILTGSIEATYDINNVDSSDDMKERKELISFRTKTKDKKTVNSNSSDDNIDSDTESEFESNNNFKARSAERTQNGSCLISYTHVAGDFLGLVSGDGPEYDLPPPKSIKTLEVCEFLRIDRRRFHQAIRVVHNQYVQEVEHFINSDSILQYLPEKEREKIIPLMAKQEYPAGKVIVNQGEFPDHLFFIGRGRCQFFRRVFIKQAHRLELVKLGQIEKGEVFGESSVLDGSPCFCSVTSIGQVTCFLINKWVIKTNESFLNLLREHRHIFYEDDVIQHFIRDSDVWQSYKRSQIIELLDATNKQFISVKQKDMQEILERALEFGDAKRCHSSRASRHREIGEPERQEPLFVVPRSRRRSSAILHSNAAAVVKAVLLLRRSNEDKDIQLPPLKPKPQRIKPVSAPSRYRSDTAPTSSTKDYRSTEKNRSEDFGFQWNGRPKSTGDSLRTRKTRPISSSREGNSKSREKEKTVSSPQANLPDKSKRRTKTPKSTIESSKHTTTTKVNKSKHFENHEGNDTNNAPGVEKCFSLNKNFIVKEIINTGNPNRQTSPQRYQRFDKSMFSILDGSNDKTGGKKVGPSPWEISLVASKWMAGIRRKRIQARVEKDSVFTPSPTPPPLIVIEEYAPQNGQSDDGSDDEAGDEMKIRPVVRSLRTPTPSLEQLDEEDDEDIDEYNKHEAGKPPEEKWYTSIHEARDESKSYLKQLRIDVKELKRNREKRKQKTQDSKTPKVDEEPKPIDEQSQNRADEKKEVETTTISSHRIRKHSTRSAATSSTSDNKTVGSSRSRKSSRMGRHSVHYSADQSINPVVSCRYINAISSVKTKHEKRRLLLLDKIGL